MLVSGVALVYFLLDPPERRNPMTTFTFGKQQAAGIDKLDAWFQHGDERIFRLFGYAGTGKTTLAKEIERRYGRRIVMEDRKGNEVYTSSVQYGAYTGKAAHVMRLNGCTNAKTLHSMIYIKLADELDALITMLTEKAATASTEELPEIQAKLDQAYKDKSKASREMRWTINDYSTLSEAELLVIDECSMVNEEMARDILNNFQCKILVLGDPAQLPPVGGAGYFINATPDVMLDEIHRQAADNPIIRLASAVREGGRLPRGQFGESEVFERSSHSVAERQKLIMDADQVLVGKNDTRVKLNHAMRRELGKPDGTPVVGDRVICLRNNKEEGTFNGATFVVEGVRDSKHRPGYYDMDVVMDGDGDKKTLLQVHPFHFSGISEDKKTGHLLNVADPSPGAERAIRHALTYEGNQLDFAYALTCHKSQGSQWDNVYVRDESSSFRNDARKWLYTAITRAAKRVTIEL